MKRALHIGQTSILDMTTSWTHHRGRPVARFSLKTWVSDILDENPTN
jgi:hypothetical protein